jgi:hypothetical protein
MQYMLIFQEPGSEFAKRKDPAESDKYWGAWNAYIGAMSAAGIVRSGNGLEPPETGTTLRIRDGKRQVQDGPYADVKEHLGGYFVIDVPSLDVALEWAARSPASAVGQTEVRPLMAPRQR